jgi:hypothetical protein
MKCPKQPELVCPFYNIRASARPMVAFSGFYESHELPSSGDVRGIVPLHRDGHRNGQQEGTFCIIVFVLSPWRPPGRYGASSHLMAAFSGFQCSHGHAASGDAACTASSPPHGHQNGLRRRNICSSSQIFCSTLLIANDYVMAH